MVHQRRRLIDGVHLGIGMVTKSFRELLFAPVDSEGESGSEEQGEQSVRFRDPSCMETLPAEANGSVDRNVEGRVASSDSDNSGDSTDDEDEDLLVTARTIKVMYSSLEHKLPDLPKAGATAGGLGKVTSLISCHHPSDIIMVHPMLKQDGRVSYMGVTEEDHPLRVVVDGVKEKVRVFRHVCYPRGPRGPRADFLLLSHPLFEARAKDTIYPNPMTRRAVLRFYSLWNQAIAALLVQHRPHIFHCPDFHSAIAPWYAVSAHADLKVLLVLHNAEYQGTIATDMMIGEPLTGVAQIFNLSVKKVRAHLVHEGRFNMLKAAVDFVMERQRGKGVAAVSKFYAEECLCNYSIFWPLPTVGGLDNPMLEEERPVFNGSLETVKAEAKAKIQESLGLARNPDARMFVSIGRLVRQKGVDLVADVAPWLLSQYPDSQLVVVGPIGDGYGHYAAQKLEALAKDPQHRGQLFVKPEFWKAPPALKLAADFCLMPSRDEPFGYVDIEFAWHGALTVGAQAGGLGKVPGFYFIAQNRENLSRLRRELKTAISDAMMTPPARLQLMSRQALQCTFPLARWQRRLLMQYKNLEPQLMWNAKSRMRVVDISPMSTRSGCMSLTVSAIESASEPQLQPQLQVPDELANGDDEFLVQELAEDELAERVKTQIVDHPDMNIVRVLERVGAEQDCSRETCPLSRWLLRSTFGVLRVHLMVSMGYIASPAGSLLTVVMATEWNLRAGGTIFRHDDNPKTKDKLPAQLLGMFLFSTDALAYVFGLPIWAALCRRVEPRKVMSANLLLRAPMALALLAPVNPNVTLAIAMTFINGLLASGSLLFVAFNFMMSIKADMSRIALRLGLLEMCRYTISQLLVAYIFGASPTSLMGTTDNPLPASVALVVLPLAIVVLITCIVPGVLLLYAPGAYRDDRFPGWDFKLIGKRKSFLLLAISNCIGSLGAYPAGTYVMWWLANGWTTEDCISLSIALAAAIALGMMLWAAGLAVTARHGLSFLIGVVILLAPPAVLRAAAQQEVATYTHSRFSYAAVIISILSLTLEAIRASAIWTAQIRILNSRWRFLSYATVFHMIGQFCAALSPAVGFLCTYLFGGSFTSTNQKDLADAVLASLVPIFMLQFAVQVCSAPFIRAEMGVAIHVDRGARQGLLRRCLKKNAFVIFAFLSAAFALTLFIASLELGIPLAPHRVFNCHSSVAPTCTVLEDVVDARAAEYGTGYGPNAYNQSTTGKANCLGRMNAVKGDTFAFWPSGRCQVQKCAGEPSWAGGRTAQNSQEMETWSLHCRMTGTNIIAVHLFEWRWLDVAQECEDWLGPAGFNVVQVSPPAEHAVGDSWTVRYQPVSYHLDSRSGSETEFVDMVRRCKNAGVSVMVDAVINHMAGVFLQTEEHRPFGRCNPDPPPQKSAETWKKTVSCQGWMGTPYGDREFLYGRPGLDHFTKSDFHHYLGNDGSNCGWGGPLCDMLALPDLNTEHFDVQVKVARFLGRLNEIGVTHLRIDAGLFVYPASVQVILGSMAWDYVVQEYTHYDREWQAVQQSLTFSHMTQFRYGGIMAQIMLDSFDQWAGRWVDRSSNFAQLLRFRGGSIEAPCSFQDCSMPIPVEKALHFVDNHDTQRERWKEKFNGPPSSPMCMWEVDRVLGKCILNYKNGLQYRAAQQFTLAWPYGADSNRLMSSYAWHTFDQGPPNVQPNSLRSVPTRVHEDGTGRDRCRGTPDTSPVTEAYDMDRDNPWVCEHRWEGIVGLVRLRQMLSQHNSDRRIEVGHTWSDPQGRIAFSLSNVSFVAISRGWNWITKGGSNSTVNLAGLQTDMAAGSYCNLAQERRPVPRPNSLGWSCDRSSSPVIILANGTISSAVLPSGGGVAVHVSYPSS